MSLSFSEVVMLAALLVIYLFMLVGIKKFHGVELIKNTDKREKLISAAALLIMIFAASVFAVKYCEYTVFEKGLINEKMSGIFYEIYGDGFAFIYFVKFVILELPGLFMCMMAVKNIAIKLKVPHVNYAYLILTAVFCTGTYCIMENNWTGNIVLLLTALFVLCLSDCLVYGATKKKAAYMLLNILLIAVICLIDRNISVKVFAYAAVIFAAQLILVVLLKTSYRLRNIWQKLIVLLYFIAVFLINWKILW